MFPNHLYKWERCTTHAQHMKKVILHVSVNGNAIHGVLAFNTVHLYGIVVHLDVQDGMGHVLRAEAAVI